VALGKRIEQSLLVGKELVHGSHGHTGLRCNLSRSGRVVSDRDELLRRRIEDTGNGAPTACLYGNAP
jgi:hypothetical protein